MADRLEHNRGFPASVVIAKYDVLTLPCGCASCGIWRFSLAFMTGGCQYLDNM